MSFRSRTLGFWALPVALLLSVSACQSTTPPTEPTASPSASSAISSSSPTESATPTPVPASADGPAQNIPVPEMPDKARENSKQGALEFARHYFDIVNYSLETYDAEPLALITSRSCFQCGEFLIDPIRSNAENGNWQVGGMYRTTDFMLSKYEKNKSIVSFMITRQGKKMYDSPNNLVEDSPAITQPRVAGASLSYDNGWILLDLKFQTEE